MATWLRRLSSWLTRAGPEGQFHPGPYLFSDGWLPSGTPWNYWQMGQNPKPYGECSAMVEACISAYAQSVAMLPGDHWRGLDNGGRERVKSSALSRIMRHPNDYLSISDFLLNLTRRLFTNGNAYALAVRNARGEIIELHLMKEGRPSVAEDGSIFYALAGNAIIEKRFSLAEPIPARDVLHVRLDTPVHPLVGVSPILAVALDLAMSGAALNQQIAFYLNGAKPSFMLETDLVIKREEAEDLRKRWIEQTTGVNAGGTPILTAGLKAHAVTMSANDGRLAEMLKMNSDNIALAFRIPLQILGVGGTPFASTEALNSSWVASSLGFVLNHIEESFGVLFRLKGQPDEYLELDTAALLHSAFKDTIDALGLGVMRGIYSPDEARARVELPKVPGGHGAEPRVQQQVVPLSYGSAMQPPTPAPATPPPATPPPEAPPPANLEAEYAAAVDRAISAFRASNGQHLADAA